MENFIKEAKSGFYFDKTDSPLFLENHVRMMISVLTYNLVNFFKDHCLWEIESAHDDSFHSSEIA